MPDIHDIISGSPFGRFMGIETRIDEQGVLAILPARDNLIWRTFISGDWARSSSPRTLPPCWA